MTENRGQLMAKIRERVTFYKVTAIYVCVMVTLILLAILLDIRIEVH